MKASALMLGDIVLYECDGQKFPARVIEIYRNSVLVESINGEYEPIEIEEDKIFPVELTPEILEKNGFTNGEFYAESHIEDWQIMSDGSHLAARSERGWCIDIPCRYVHELQHALRLCGIEKEITI